MFNNTFRFLHRSSTVWLGMLVVFGMLFGCGGGGDTNTQSANQSPTALIVSPSGTYFKEGENIAFNGTGTDKEDGQLNGSALEWTSSVDGSLGTGSTLITSALTAGDHEITLSATDSVGSAHTTDPASIHIEHTRFVKMGFQTTGVSDASNAFDGDHDTAATLVTPDIESIHFRAYIGGADTFLFKIKLGASTPGSRLAIQVFKADDSTWRLFRDIDLGTDHIVTSKIPDAQDYKDGEGYINLRVRWEGGGNGDNSSIFEIWRVDPAYAGLQTTGVNSVEWAFDAAPSTGASITSPYDSITGGPLLHFKAYVGIGVSDTFSFKILHNDIGSDQLLVIDIEDLTTPALDDWGFLQNLELDTTDAQFVSIGNAQDFLDADGYISLRLRWVNLNPNPPSNNVSIYEIWRVDPFFVGSKTLGIILNPPFAVDGDLDSFARIDYFWGEQGRNDFLHLQSYLGDVDFINFSIQTDSSGPGSVMVIDGEHEPDNWSVIERISLDDATTTKIELLNAQEYVNDDGYISLRARWESDSPHYDGYVNEFWREAN